MIPDDRDEGRVVANPCPIGALQVFKGRRVLPKPELAQSPERPRRAVVRLLSGHVDKCVPALIVPVGVVVNGAEVPVAFCPRWLQRERPLVETHRFVDAARHPGFLGLPTQPSKSTGEVAPVRWATSPGPGPPPPSPGS